MKAPNLATARRQLDHRIDGPSMTAILEPPRDGWIRTIRQVLGMRLIDLAARLNVTEGAVRRVERAEVRGSLTLKQLDRAAAAMGCRFVWGIVPETALEDIYRERLRERAFYDAGRTARTMELEQQGVGGEVTARHSEELFGDYLRHPPRDLWRD